MPARPATDAAKRRLRAEMLARRRRVPLDAAEAAARAVARVAGETPVLREAARVALYAAADGEIPTRPLFEALGAAGLERLLPRARGRRLEWVRADAWEELAPGRFGILEPAGAPAAVPGPGEAVLLPGLAFDAAGWRLGRGAGFYDRAFPASRPGPLLVGVGYAFQRVAAVPHDSRDRRLDAIVTEEEWIWCREDA